MNSVIKKISAYAQSLPEGGILTAKGLLHFGSRAAVDQALSRLAKAGKLIRAARGTYVVPVKSRFGSRPPSPHEVVRFLPSILGENVEPHGIAAANWLGLTTQVPVRPVYVTLGPSRKLQLGSQTLELQHVPRWQMLMASRPAGKAIRALAWLGENNAPSAVHTLRAKLSAEEWGALAASRSALPTWMAKVLSEALDGQ